MLRILVIAGIGYVFAKFRVVPKSFEEVISKLIACLFLPMLTLYTFMTNCTVEKLTANGSLLLFGTLLTVICMAAGYLLSGKLVPDDAYQERVMRYAMVVPNAGAFATPLTLAFLGMEGLFYQSLFLFSHTVVCYSWGIMQLQPSDRGRGAAAYARRLFNPNTVSMLIGMVLGLTNAAEWMPPILVESVSDFSDCYVPMALMLIGYAIADFPLREMLPTKTTYSFVALRMLLMPIAFLFLMKLLNAPYYACYFACAAYACPCGMNTVIYPIAYGQDCRDSVAIVLFSSAVSIVTIPLLYALIQQVA